MDIKVVNDEYKFKYRVSGIFIQSNKLLVDRYKTNSYCLPGGYVELGETSIEGILRELKEEIGLDFEILSFVGIVENFFYGRNNEKTHAVEIYYKVKLKNHNDVNRIDYNRIENDKGNIIKHEFKWLELDKINEYNLLPKEIKDELIKNETFHKIISEL